VTEATDPPRDEPADGRITADRVTLVPLAVSDAEEMADVLSGTELYEFIGGTPPSADDLRRRYARLVVGHSADRRQDWYNWIIRRNVDGRAVGTVQATVVDAGRRAEIAWVVGLAWQRQGYGSEAARSLVDWLADRRTPYITAHVHPDHHASIAVARRAGLVPTDQFDDDGERLWQWGGQPAG
jgi:RimJ/RimL family protein N-acetyltransferase